MNCILGNRCDYEIMHTWWTYFFIDTPSHQFLPVNERDKERINQSLNIYDRSSASLLVNESASQFITSSLDHLYVPQPYQSVHLHPSHRKTLDHQLSTEGCDRSHRQSTNRDKTRTIWATAR